MNLFMENDFKVLIVDKDKTINYDEQYLENIKVIDFVKELKKIDVNSLSPIKALEMLLQFKDDITNA
jgi:hypothetical protein